MAAVTRKSELKDAMDAEQDPNQRSKNLPAKVPPSYPPAGRPPVPPPATVAGPSGGRGFFHIYKKGQGHWTRLGTVAGITLVGLLTGHFIWTQCQAYSTQLRWGFILTGAFAVLYTALAFYFLNKPNNVDFLIATDSEMKKVNWTSRKELIGSTRVVIFFMFMVAIMLFVYDQFFWTIFWLIGVLKVAPPIIPGNH
jgi:preprotein translocase SecE subunit